MLYPSNPVGNPVAAGLQFVRRSRSLASMLPALLLSGVMTLVVTAVMLLLWNGWAEHFGRMWMESWLIAWPIAFPVTYLAVPLLLKLAVAMTAPAAQGMTHTQGMAFSDIGKVSERVTAAYGFTVLRDLKLKDDFRA
jgi:hypothetical protein